jgi:SanA protein
VLGAGLLTNGKLSLIFKDRIDTAVMLYKAGKVDTILVSGDDGTTTYNEVNPAREYLLTQAISSDDIFLDHAGFDTYSSMYRARDVFRVESAIIVTQSFHLPRSIFIARRLGINAYGVPADQHPYSFKNNIREVFATVKAYLNIVYNRIPKYLGEEIPITESGRESI